MINKNLHFYSYCLNLTFEMIVFFSFEHEPHRVPMEHNQLYCHNIASIYKITN